jgi:putative oxidoreductase
VPAGLVILGPIIFNILCFHMLLTSGKGIGMGAFSAVMELLLIYFYRSSLSGILTVKAQPVVAVSPTV